MMSFLVTCEHAVNDVPGDLAPLFTDSVELLQGHRGWDQGALDVALEMAGLLSAPVVTGNVSRLVIDLNRSPRNRSLFGHVTGTLERSRKDELVERYLLPYRRSVAEYIRRGTGRGILCHVSVHSFTPVLNGVRRNCSAGLLYDPSRRLEKDLCLRWKELLDPLYRVRLNYPYRGTSDGCVTSFRREFPADRYVGVELELNQELFLQDKGVIPSLACDMAVALMSAAERTLAGH